MSANIPGTLYGLGVGPGDPKLITPARGGGPGIGAGGLCRRLAKNTYSLALNIVKEHLSPEVRVVMLSFPLTKDLPTKEAAWQENAWLVLDEWPRGATPPLSPSATRSPTAPMAIWPRP